MGARSVRHVVEQLKAEETEVTVTSMTLDSIPYSGRPSMLKMDIEGAENEALRGAQQLIKRDTPFLAICAYHRQADVWELPIAVAKLNQSYQFYLRRFSSHPWDTVLFCARASGSD